MSDVVFRLPPVTIHRTISASELGEKIPWSLEQYKVPSVWPTATGKGVRVAVIDTGIDSAHQTSGDLVGAVLAKEDFSGSRWGVMDAEGHGTHVAGTIAARRNSLGVAGVAPECQLLIAKAMGDDGTGSDFAISRAIQWALDNGAQIINMSLGTPDHSPNLEAAIRMAVQEGALCVCAAGNSGGDVDFPGRYDKSIAVSAVDKMRRIAPFSCRGSAVDIAAPGVEILSTFKGGRYSIMSGTSMAAPFVSGLLALLIQINGGKLGFDDAMKALARKSTDYGPKGRDDLYGFGLPNPESFIEDDKPTASPPGDSAAATKTITVDVPAGGRVTITGGVVR